MFVKGCTAIWDDIYRAVSQIRNKTRRIVITVLIDGQDNSSTHTYEEVNELINLFPNISLDIIQIEGAGVLEYVSMCENQGYYSIIPEIDIKVHLTLSFNRERNIV